MLGAGRAVSALFLLPLLLACAAVAGVARADDDSGGFSWDHSFSIKSDLRFRLEDKSIGDWYESETLKKGIEREQNTLGAKLKMKLDKFRAVANVELTLFGYQQKLTSFDALNQSDQVQPYYFDVNELYVEADSFILKGLDVRIGQQVVQWGVADQFNPTNTLNSDDIRDPLLFGKQAGNFMIRGDYYVTPDLSWSAVLVPLFRPALLPLSAAIGPHALDRLPFIDPKLRQRIASEQAAAQSSFLQHPTVLGSTTIVEPDPTFTNMQAMFRLAWTAAQQDFALSYYTGRTKFPVPTNENTRVDNSFMGCDPIQPGRCATGLLKTDVTLQYPREHVYGFNVAGEFNPFKKIDEKINGIGYRFEGAVIVPDQTKLIVTTGDLGLAAAPPAGEYDYANDGNPAAHRPDVISDTPFLKWTLGLDYTFGSHVYVNLQWVHGFVDEFGAGDWMAPNAGRDVRQTGVSPPVVPGEDVLLNAALNCALQKDGSKCENEITRPKLGDFLVIGTDIHFLEDAALARVFVILEMNGYQWDPLESTCRHASLSIL